MNTATQGWVITGQSEPASAWTVARPQQAAGSSDGWYSMADNATIKTSPHLSGYVTDFMYPSLPIEPAEDSEYLDELDLEVARMTLPELLAAIEASAGIWADRTDLDELLDRSDRLDELYGHHPDPAD